jgi:signal transduction histidine kinase
VLRIESSLQPHEPVVGDPVPGSQSAPGAGAAISVRLTAGPASFRLSAVPASVATLRQQESILIVLDLIVLPSVALFHVAFASTLGAPTPAFFVAVAARCLMETGELFWVRSREGASVLPALQTYSTLSIGIRVCFAFLLSLLGGMQNSHYIVVMVIPVVAAGFRYRAAGIVAVVSVVSLLTVVHPYLYFRRERGPIEVGEYFEVATDVLIYVVVAAAVYSLVQRLRADQTRLAESLEALEEARDRLVAEEKLAAVGRLSSAIAHEIRNPVGMIVSSLSMLEDAEPGRRRELRGIAMSESRRLERLTSDFLTYARPRRVELRPTSLQGTLEYVAGLVGAKAAETKVSLSIDCPRDGTVWVDPFQVHQILLNLVTNALDAEPFGGHLRLGARADGSRGAELFVENSGPAIPPDVVPKLFEPFFTTRPTGTGLGLAIAQGIALAHGGELVLDSNEPGRVRFSLRLPPGGKDVPEKEAAWRAS